MGRYFLIILLVPLVLACNDDTGGITDYNKLSNLPLDTGGIHSAHVHLSTNSPYGFYIYTPSGYSLEGVKFPLMVFLHGSGEKGNSSTDATKLDLVLKNGPPKLIEEDAWAPEYPMIVASPQCHDGSWNSKKVHQFIEFLLEEYKVNKNRIYVTGLSMGGMGTFGYAGDYGDSCYAAAVIPICGSGNLNKAQNFKNIPVWAFHGDDDKTVLPINSINMVNAINENSPKTKAKLTMYPGVAHNSWARTYDGTGMGTERDDYDAFNEDIYHWLFRYTKQFEE